MRLPGPGCRLRAVALALAATALLSPLSPASAQLRLPRPGLSNPLPGVLQPQVPPSPLSPAATLPDLLPAGLPLEELRAATVRDLLRAHRELIEADPAGEPVRRHELVWSPPDEGALKRALELGFAVLREHPLPELGLRELTLRAPDGMTLAEALARLRAIDPEGASDYNHLYTRSGGLAGGSGAPPPGPASPPGPRRVGLVDGGVDSGHEALRAAHLVRWGCEGRARPSEHGTAVASLLVGRHGRFAGALPDAELYAADIYCEEAAGGAVDTLVQALAWLARERVAVINISLVGPSNRLLQQAVQALLRKGHVLVAAVGNDGPAAPPLYPASYPGVIGVTGVSPERRVLPEAAQGPQVMVAAPGDELAAARAGGGYAVARGTSFAAPLVAGLLAQRLRDPDPAAAAEAVARMTAGAIDLGAPGRDPVFGFGLVAEDLRVAPDRVQAQSR